MTAYSLQNPTTNSQAYTVKLIQKGPTLFTTSPESLPHELRQVARMIDVGMGKNDVIYRGGIERQMPVFFERLLAATLIQSAIKKDSLAGSLDKMHRSRRRASCAVKSYFHLAFLNRFVLR